MARQSIVNHRGRRFVTNLEELRPAAKPQMLPNASLNSAMSVCPPAAVANRWTAPIRLRRWGPCCSHCRKVLFLVYQSSSVYRNFHSP